MFPLLHVTLYSKVQYCFNLCQVDFGNFFFPLTIYLYYILIICVPNSTKLKTKFPLEFQSHLIFPLQSPKLFKIVYRSRQYTIQRKKSQASQSHWRGVEAGLHHRWPRVHAPFTSLSLSFITCKIGPFFMDQISLGMSWAFALHKQYCLFLTFLCCFDIFVFYIIIQSIDTYIMANIQRCFLSSFLSFFTWPYII